MNNTTLISGQEYSLKALFTGKNKIIIPDLQRDYCWGDKAWDKDKKYHTELVSNFVDNLYNSYVSNNNNNKLTLGLIYGYENPKYNIQLCDGQQRITTLYLLLGSINRKTNNHFQNNLISTFELENDDKEPYLQYAIRESTLYFLSDLVCEFFLNNKIEIEDIKNQDWYFSEYDLDASIVSMIKALKLIDKILLNKSDEELKGFGTFIVENLQMIYYDMGNRTRGEETFVVINTTGEPLTPTENLKPILLGSVKNEKERARYSKEWEEREQWFWEHRKGKGKKENLISDNGLNEFLRWVWVIKNSDDKKLLEEFQEKNNIQLYKNLDLDEIHKYYNIVKSLFKDSPVIFNDLDWLSPDIKTNYRNALVTLLKLLPVIEYRKIFTDANTRDIIRVRNFFENLCRLDSVNKNVSSLLPEAIGLIKKLPTKDIASIINLDNASVSIVSAEEKLKFELYLNAKQDRESLEEMFWHAESHKVLNGEIQILIECVKTTDGNFDKDRFKKYYNAFNTILHDDLRYPELDITRRVMLTQNLKDYPRIFKGWTNLSFCQKFSDWKTLILDNKDKFICFLNRLIDQKDVYRVQEEMIDNYLKNDNLNNDYWSDFILRPCLLKYCEEKNIQIHGNLGIVLIRWDRASGPHANVKSYLLYLDLEKKSFWNKDIWKINFYDKEKTFTIFFHKEKNVAIYIFYVGDNNYQLHVFCIDNKNNTKENLNDLAVTCTLKWNGERYESKLYNYEVIVKFIKKITSFLN